MEPSGGWPFDDPPGNALATPSVSILVAGGGAVGSWLAAALAAGGADVTLVARGDRGRRIAASGLEWSAGAHTQALKIPVVPSVAAAASRGRGYDAVAVTVKSYDTVDLARELSATPPACVISFQNGVGNEAALARILTDRPILPATVTAAVAAPGARTVTSSRRGGVGLSATPWTLHPRQSGAPGLAATGDTLHLVRSIAACLGSAGVQAQVYGDGAAMKWSKLLLNVVGAATAALLLWPRSRILADRSLSDIEKLAWLEALAVARGLHCRPVALPGYPINVLAPLVPLVPTRIVAAVVARLADPGGDHRLPGTARDLALGRGTCEVDVLNGAVVRAASGLGLAVPWNKALVMAVTQVTSGRLSKGHYEGRPDALAADVAAWATRG